MSSAVAIRRTPRASGMPSTSKALITAAQLCGHGFIVSASRKSSALIAPSSDSSSMNQLKRCGSVGECASPKKRTSKPAPLIPALLEDRGYLVVVRIDQGISEDV